MPASAKTAHAYQALANTAAPDTATPEAVGSGKRDSNCARPKECKNVSPRLPADPDSDVTSADSFGGIDCDSQYVKLTKNSPTSLAVTPNLAGHIREKETMHEVSEIEIDAIV